MRSLIYRWTLPVCEQLSACTLASIAGGRLAPGITAVVAAAFAGIALGAPSLATAQDARAHSYPDHQVRIVAGYPPGGSVDANARLLGQQLSERWKQPVVVENRAGAGSSIGTAAIAQAAPDGYSMLVASPAHAINATLYKSLPFDTETAFTPVAKLSVTPLFLVLHPSVKANSVQELIALAKADPGGLNYASSGTGTSVHLAGALFNLMAGSRMTHIPYHGGSPAITALLAGDVQVMFSASEVLPHVRSGKLKMIAVTTGTRSSEYPELPTIAESGLPGYDVETWYGLYLPAGTPASIVNQLNRDVNAVLQNPETKAKFLKLGYTVEDTTPEQFAAFTQNEIEKWRKVVQHSGATAN